MWVRHGWGIWESVCFLFQRGVHVFCVLVFGSQGLKSELGGGVQLCTEEGVRCVRSWGLVWNIGASRGWGRGAGGCRVRLVYEGVCVSRCHLV